MDNLEPDDYKLHKVLFKKIPASREHHDLCQPCIFYDAEESVNEVFCTAHDQGIDFVGCHSTDTYTVVYRRKLISILKNL